MRRSLSANLTGLRADHNHERGWSLYDHERPALDVHDHCGGAGIQDPDRTNNKLDPASNLTVDVSLTVGAATETVEVTSIAPPLQTESATVQKVVNREQIDALELNGRNPIFMANLVPGVRGGNLSCKGFGMTTGRKHQRRAQPGQPDHIRRRSGGPHPFERHRYRAPDVDSTQEIQVLTSDYAPEYGRSSGGQIRILTKSGTSDFHGAAYEYLRNNEFNANTWVRNKGGPGFRSAIPVQPVRL